MSLQQADGELARDEERERLPLPGEIESETEVRPRRPRRRRRRWLLIGLLVLLLAGAGVAVWASFFRTSGAATTLRTVTVTAGTLKQTVSGTGTLQPASEAALSFGSSGTVSSVEVEVGDTVKKGQALASIDDSELAIDLDSAKASRTEAEDSLTALQNADDSTAAAIAAAEATVEVKKNAVTQARAAVSAATLTSPIAGKVAEVTVSKGDSVSGGSSSSSTGATGSSGSSGTAGGTSGAAAGSSSTSTSSTSAVTVISSGTFEVTTSVSNADLTSVKKGLQATIIPTSSSTPVFGTVTSVGVVASASSGTSSAGSSTFPVTIAVTGKHPDLLPGSSATVGITVKQLADALSVPAQAVTTVDGRTVVQKLVDGHQVQTAVTLGDTIGSATVVKSGLSDGDQVVIASFRAPAAGSGTGTGTGRQGTGQQGGTGGLPGAGAGGFPGSGTGAGAGTGGTR